jgi:hypothetical protein
LRAAATNFIEQAVFPSKAALLLLPSDIDNFTMQAVSPLSISIVARRPLAAYREIRPIQSRSAVGPGSL